MTRLFAMSIALISVFLFSEVNAEEQYAPVVSNKQVYEFIRTYSNTLVNKDFDVYKAVLNKSVIEYFINKDINIRGQKIPFLRYLFLLESDDVSSILKSVISEPEKIQYAIADFGSAPGYFNKELSISAYKIDEKTLKELHIIHSANPNHRFIMPIVYDNGVISKIISADMLERQEEMDNYIKK